MYSSYTNYLSSEIKDITIFPFKTNPIYNGILEHVSYDLGLLYVDEIKKHNIPFNIISEIVEKNDLLGNPNKYTFKLDENIVNCSPSTLRYIDHAYRILTHLKTLNNNDTINIVEIGAGYGGLCLVIYLLNKHTLFQLNINDYNIVDLDEPLKLQEKYLNYHKNNSSLTFDLNFHSAFSHGMTVQKDNLFVISNYCLSEIDSVFRNMYYSILFPKIKHGFFIWNHNEIDLPSSINYISKSESPQTDLNNHFNKEVTF